MPPRKKRTRSARRPNLWLAALLGLAAGIGLFLAGTQLGPKPTPTPQNTTNNHQIPAAPTSPTPQTPSNASITPSLQSLLEQTDTALQTPTPTTPVPPASAPNWVKNATPVSASGPVLAIVIDDMGEDAAQTKKALQILPYTVTMAFLPYPPATPALAKQARSAGHELLIHFPMQPKGELKQQLSPQSTMLLTSDTPEALTAKINKNLNELSPLVVGINNHMGSAFTQNLPGMTLLLKELDSRRLLFLDSLTIAPTATAKATQGTTIPTLTRNVFLDDKLDEAVIQKELERAIRHAQTHGSAIAIGHPHQQTLNVLERNLDAIAAAGVTLVPLTHLLPTP